MKKLIYLLFITAFIPTMLHAQEPLKVDTVLQAPNMSKEQIYSIAKQWFVDNMNDASEVIQLDDEKNCILMGKYNIPFEVNSFLFGNLSGYLKNTIKIQARDGRYRLQFYDVIHSAKGLSSPAWDQGAVYTAVPENMPQVKRKSYSVMIKHATPTFLEYCTYTITSLQKAMEEFNNLSEDNDW